MKALVWHGKEDIRCDTVSNPAIEQARHASDVMSWAICGSDLHLFHNVRPRHIRYGPALRQPTRRNAGSAFALLTGSRYSTSRPMSGSSPRIAANRLIAASIRTAAAGRMGFERLADRPQEHQDAAGRLRRGDHRRRICSRLDQASPAELPPVKLEADRRAGAHPGRKQGRLRVMASRVMRAWPGDQPRRSRPSPDSPAIGPARGLDRIAVTLGTAALVARYGSQNSLGTPTWIGCSATLSRASSTRPTSRRRFSLKDAPRGYDGFKPKTDGCVRAVFRVPNRAPAVEAQTRDAVRREVIQLKRR